MSSNNPAAPFDFSLYRLARQNKLNKWHLEYVFHCASTQELAKKAAESGATGGNIWIAEHQESGKGRFERKWESPAGGLWFSMLLRPSINPAEAPPLALVAGYCLSETVDAVAGIRALLKWPNDLVIKSRGQWKKIGGILTEMSGETDHLNWLVLGIGLNVFNVLPESIKDRAASIQTVTVKQFSRGEMLADFLKRFRAAYEKFQKKGFKPFRQAYWDRYSRPDEPVRIKTAGGIITGRSRGIDQRGCLEIVSANDTVHLFEGEIIS